MLVCIAPVVQGPEDCVFTLSVNRLHAACHEVEWLKPDAGTLLKSLLSSRNTAETRRVMYAFTDRHGRKPTGQ
jgi:transposase-like protein